MKSTASEPGLRQLKVFNGHGIRGSWSTLINCRTEFFFGENLSTNFGLIAVFVLFHAFSKLRKSTCV